MTETGELRNWRRVERFIPVDQGDEPLYAVNEEGLQSMLRQKTERFTRRMLWQRRLTYGGTLTVVVPIVLFLIGHFGRLP